MTCRWQKFDRCKCQMYLNSQRLLVASPLTQPVWPLRCTFSIRWLSGGSHASMLFPKLPQNTWLWLSPSAVESATRLNTGAASEVRRTASDRPLVDGTESGRDASCRCIRLLSMRTQAQAPNIWPVPEVSTAPKTCPKKLLPPLCYRLQHQIGIETVQQHSSKVVRND